MSARMHDERARSGMDRPRPWRKRTSRAAKTPPLPLSTASLLPRLGHNDAGPSPRHPSKRFHLLEPEAADHVAASPTYGPADQLAVRRAGAENGLRFGSPECPQTTESWQDGRIMVE